MSAVAIVATTWLLIGLIVIALLIDRSDLIELVAGALAVIGWPAVLVAQVIQLRRRHRREVERQARIAAKVRAGEYSVDQAVRLGWKGLAS